ncbi:MAG: hypothetical protein D6698_16285 [Gammaproteobacteria bacterium]|nr:MAG: hypothetical protein D6698_16285 [Gammaproteobacteria bacterium]
MRPKYEGKREGLTIVRKEYETLAMHKVKSLNELISKYWPGVFVARDDGFILSTGTRLYGSCFTVHGFRGNVYYSMTFFPRMRSIGDDGEHKITDPDKEIGDVDMKCLFLSFTDDGYEAVRKDFGWTRLSLSYRDVIDMATGEFAAISAKINNQPLRELLAASPKDVPLVLTLI